MLDLKPLDELALEPDYLQRGGLIHDVLAELHRSLNAEHGGPASLTQWEWSQLEEKIRSRVEDAISKILGVPEDADYPPDLKAVLGGLYGVRNAISLLRYRRRITQSIIALSLLAFLGMYLYLALLFSFAYFGIAKVELIPYTWAEALVTSIFIPFA